MGNEFDKLNDSLDIDFEEAEAKVEEIKVKKNEIAEKVHAMVNSSRVRN